MALKKFKKRYQVWVDYGYDGWSYEEYDTLEQCVQRTNYGSDYYITERVSAKVKVVVKKTSK